MKKVWVIIITCLVIVLFLPWLDQFIYGYPSDLFGYLHRGWWYRYALAHGLASNFNPLINYPVGISYLFPFHPVVIYPLSLFSLLLGEVRAYNILFLSFLALNFLIPFLVIKRLLGRAVPAFLGAFFIISSQYILWHGMQNIEVSFVALLVLFIWLLFRFCDRPDVKNTILLAAALAFSTLAFFQYGYFATLLLAVFVLFTAVGHLVDGSARPLVVRTVLMTLVVCILAAGLTLPWTWRVAVGFISPDKVANEFITSGFVRNSVYDLVAYGARPWDYLMPSIFHPVLGEGVQRFYNVINNYPNFTYHSTFLPERANFIPITVWLLALAGAVFGLRSERYRGLVVKSLAGLVFSGWLSLPAFMHVKGLKIYGLSYFLFKFFPMFRVYARAGALVLIFAVFLAGVGLSLILEWIERRTLPRWATSVLLASILVIGMFENLHFPPFHLVEVDQRPPLYNWLASQPGGTVVVEYPRDTVDLGGGCAQNFEKGNLRDYPPPYESLFQRVHEKAVFNFRLMSDQERLTAADLAHPETPAILSKQNVDYILWHTKDYFPAPNPLDPCQEYRYGPAPEQVAEGLEEVVRFEDGVVYKVNYRISCRIRLLI